MQAAQDILFRARMVLLNKCSGQAQHLKLVGPKSLQEKPSFVLKYLWRKDHYVTELTRFNSYLHGVSADCSGLLCLTGK